MSVVEDVVVDVLEVEEVVDDVVEVVDDVEVVEVVVEVEVVEVDVVEVVDVLVVEVSVAPVPVAPVEPVPVGSPKIPARTASPLFGPAFAPTRSQAAKRMYRSNKRDFAREEWALMIQALAPSRVVK